MSDKQSKESPAGPADVIISTGFSEVFFNLKFDPAKIQKGKLLAKRNVRDVVELRSVGCNSIIKAKVIKTTSEKKEYWNTSIEIDEQRMVKYQDCNCFSKEAVAIKPCKHIYALIHWLKTDRSSTKTSEGQQWGGPSDKLLADDKYAKPLLIKTEFPKKVVQKEVAARDLSFDDFKDINCPLQTMFAVAEHKKDDLIIRNLLNEVVTKAVILCNQSEAEGCANNLYVLASETELCYSNQMILSQEILEFYNTKILLSEQEIISVCGETVAQKNVQKWFDFRFLRLSASSKAHKVLVWYKNNLTVKKKEEKGEPKSKRQKVLKNISPNVMTQHSKPKTSDKCINNINSSNEMIENMSNALTVEDDCDVESEIAQKNLTTKEKKIKTLDDLAIYFINLDKKPKIKTKSTDYGNTHESEAIMEYSTKNKALVKSIGVFAMPLQPWLCASPDGVIVENDMVVKLLEVKCPYTCADKPIVFNDKINVPYLIMSEKKVNLKKNNQYYTQCQIQMYCTGTLECDFFVWSSKGSHLVIVDRDEEFLSRAIPDLEEFYFKYYLPALISEEEIKN